MCTGCTHVFPHLYRYTLYMYFYFKSTWKICYSFLTWLTPDWANALLKCSAVDLNYPVTTEVSSELAS